MDTPHSDNAVVMSMLAPPAARPGRLLSLPQAQARLGTQHLSTQLPRGGAHRRSPALHLTSFMRLRLPGSIQRLGSSWCMELENLNSQQAPAGHQVLSPLPSQSLQGKDGISWGEQNPNAFHALLHRACLLPHTVSHHSCPWCGLGFVPGQKAGVSLLSTFPIYLHLDRTRWKATGLGLVSGSRKPRASSLNSGLTSI